MFKFLPTLFVSNQISYCHLGGFKLLTVLILDGTRTFYQKKTLNHDFFCLFDYIRFPNKICDIVALLSGLNESALINLNQVVMRPVV